MSNQRKRIHFPFLTCMAIAVTTLNASATGAWTESPFASGVEDDVEVHSIDVDSDGEAVWAYVKNGELYLAYNAGANTTAKLDDELYTFVTNVVSASMVVNPGSTDDEVCILYSTHYTKSPGIRFTKFHYIVGDIDTTWTETDRGTVEKDIIHADYSDDTNPISWFDSTVCDAAVAAYIDPYPHDHYGDGSPYSSEREASRVKVAYTGGSYWFACSFGTMLDHYPENPTDYRFEDHIGTYVFEYTVSGTTAHQHTYYEHCEPSNAYAPNPATHLMEMVGDRTDSGDENWILSIHQSGWQEQLGADITTASIGTTSRPKYASTEGQIYVVYQDGSDVKYKGWTPSGWDVSSTLILANSSHLAAGIDANDDVYAAVKKYGSWYLYQGSTSQGQIYFDESCCDVIGNFVSDRIVLEGSPSGSPYTPKAYMLLDYGIEDRRGDLDWYTGEVWEN